MNAFGVFAAITNRRCAEPDASRRSRGLLVMDALHAGSAAEAAKKIGGLPIGAYNPFNLFLADREGAWLLTYGEGPLLLELGPGVHVIGNVDPTAETPPKLARLAGRARRAAEAGSDYVLDALAEVCRSHDGDGGAFDDPCVHTPGYGTRSSALLRLGEGCDGGAFRFAEGAPCETEYEDFTPLLVELSRRAPFAGESSMRKVS